MPSLKCSWILSLHSIPSVVNKYKAHLHLLIKTLSLFLYYLMCLSSYQRECLSGKSHISFLFSRDPFKPLNFSANLFLKQRKLFLKKNLFLRQRKFFEFLASPNVMLLHKAAAAAGVWQIPFLWSQNLACSNHCAQSGLMPPSV